LQADEIWAFVGCKEKNVTAEKKAQGQGDAWTWLAMCADTKLLACWYVGTRDGGAAYHFIHDLAGRLASRVQLTTDGHKAYLTAVEDAFGTQIDYAMLNKIYGAAPEGPQQRYSPAQCMGAKKAAITGSPDFNHVSTSYVERQNLTLRMSNRRFTRLTNGYSKKVENHEHSVALYAMHYNFCRIHHSLRVTPAMAAGVTDHVWELEEVIALLDKTSEEKAA
jgi:IS1 family transposase